MYFINDTTDTARFYNLDRTRDATRDIALGTGVWDGGLGLSDGMYFIDDTTDTARFYNLDRTRDATRDITLGTGNWLGGLGLY